MATVERREIHECSTEIVLRGSDGSYGVEEVSHGPIPGRSTTGMVRVYQKLRKFDRNDAPTAATSSA